MLLQGLAAIETVLGESGARHRSEDRTQKEKAAATGAATNERRGMGVNQTGTLEAISKLVAEQVAQQLPRLVQEEVAKQLPRLLESSSWQCALIPAASREGASTRSPAIDAAAAAHHVDRRATMQAACNAQHSTQKRPPTPAQPVKTEPRG